MVDIMKGITLKMLSNKQYINYISNLWFKCRIKGKVRFKYKQIYCNILND